MEVPVALPLRQHLVVSVFFVLAIMMEVFLTVVLIFISLLHNDEHIFVYIRPLVTCSSAFVHFLALFIFY